MKFKQQSLMVRDYETRKHVYAMKSRSYGCTEIYEGKSIRKKGCKWM